MVCSRLGVGEMKCMGRQIRAVHVMRMVRMVRGFGDRAAQHLGYRRRDHAQQDREHPEKSPDLLTVAAGHG